MCKCVFVFVHVCYSPLNTRWGCETSAASWSFLRSGSVFERVGAAVILMSRSQNEKGRDGGVCYRVCVFSGVALSLFHSGVTAPESERH